MIVFVLIFGLILRLISINQSLWLDEATSALAVKMSLADFFTKFIPSDFHPPLYYLALRSWSFLFGKSEIALRSFSVLLGVGTIYIVYLIGKDLVSKKTGLIASLLLATSGLFIYYSQEARMYMMASFLVSLTVFFFTQILHGRKGRVKRYAILGLLFSAILLTDYLAFLIIIPIWIYLLSVKKSFHEYKKFVTSYIILGIFGLVWLPFFLKQLATGLKVTTSSPAWTNVLGKFSIKDILLIPVKFAVGRVSFDNKFLYAFIIILFFTSCFYIFCKTIKSSKNLRLIWFWLLIPVFVSIIISIKIPVLNYFRFLFLLPAFYILIANSIASLKRGWQELFLIFFLLLNLITSGMYLFNQKFHREDWRSAVSYIEHNKIKNSVIIFPADSQMEAFRYYAPDEKLYGPKGVMNNSSEIWLIRYAQPISDPNDTTRLKIERMRYKKIHEFDFGGVVIWKYSSYSLK